MIGRRAVTRVFGAARLLCQTASNSANKILTDLVKSDKVVVFMKGVPEEPQCGFSNLVVQIMNLHKVPFTAINVLESQDIREGIKKFSDWPTIPQVYIDGKFVGGADILLQMHRTGTLIDSLQKAGIKSSLTD